MPCLQNPFSSSLFRLGLGSLGVRCKSFQFFFISTRNNQFVTGEKGTFSSSLFRLAAYLHSFPTPGFQFFFISTLVPQQLAVEAAAFSSSLFRRCYCSCTYSEVYFQFFFISTQYHYWSKNGNKLSVLLYFDLRWHERDCKLNRFQFFFISTSMAGVCY